MHGPFGGKRTYRRGLQLEEVPQYLLSHDLMPDEYALSTDIEFRDDSSRNRVFKAILGDDLGYLIKQPGPDSSPEGLRIEADFLTKFAESGAPPSLKMMMPTPVHWDDTQDTFAVELLEPSTSLQKVILNGGNPTFHPEITQKLATFMAQLHDHPTTNEPLGPWMSGHTAPIHNVLLERNFGMGPDPRRVSGGVAWGVEQYRKNKAFLDAAQHVEASWQPTRIMHGDVRWNNVLVGIGDLDDPNMLVIDWEFARLGEPAWDIAAYIAEYARFWARATGPADPERTAAEHRTAFDEGLAQGISMASMIPDMQLFWSQYVASRDAASIDVDDLRARVREMLPFAALRASLESNLLAQQPNWPGRVLHEASMAFFEDSPTPRGAHLRDALLEALA